MTGSKISKMPQVSLMGNPNSGKSTLFNRLTGSNQHIGNWPGVTVERVEGGLTHNGHNYEVIDLPGTYALVEDNEEFSLDEKIAQQALLSQSSDLYVNIVDASNLSRHLFLSSQLLQYPVNTLLVLNMMDVAESNGLSIDLDELSRQLSCSVVAISANTGAGLTELKDKIQDCLETKVDREHTDNISIAKHYERVEHWVKKCVQNNNVSRSLDQKIDNIVLNKYLAFPVFLFVIYCMFMFSINIGSAFIDFFDGIAGLLFVETPYFLLTKLGLPAWLNVFLSNGIGGGIQLVASFIPVIGAMFLILAWLEDSGYMARAAFVMDKIMRQLGLPGKAFVPLIVGFGCNVPAVMATRTLENERDRITAVLMAPFMSCGARLTVYALFAAAFFPLGGHNIVFALYLIGIVIAVLSAFVMKKTLLQGESGHFVMELPAYHLPLLRNIIVRAWHRLHGFIVRAGKAIVMVVIVLNVVNSLGIDGSFGNENTEKSALSQIGKAITPLFGPMGIKEENWPATVGIFTGVFAKEVVVGTLDSLYAPKQTESKVFDFSASVMASLQSIPENLTDLADQIVDPLGLNILSTTDSEAVAEEQDISSTTFGAMQSLFDGKIGAFTYLLFVLLYIPCVATVGAMYRELNTQWSAFITLWTLGSGYGVAVGFYQLATFNRHPSSSALWLTSITVITVALVYCLRRYANKAEFAKSRLIIARSSG